MNYAARLASLRRATRKQEAFVVSHGANVRYACGFSGSSGMLLIAPQQAFFITDFRYRAQAALQVDAAFQVVIAERGLWREAARLVKKFKWASVGFEAEHTSVAALRGIEKQLAPSRAVATESVVETLRLAKDEAEIAIIRRAIAVIDECFEHICGFIWEGQTEIEVADELSRQMRLRGASGPSFSTIVASGERGALPHGIASDKIINRGDMITIDMGAIVEGYCSDCTRTICLGTPTPRQQEIYEIVWRAQVEAAAALRPGLGCKAADAIARRVIGEAGFGAAFGHGLGHGVGMDIHEPPRLSKLGRGLLKPGMIVTCEPGIYLEGWGGVRIEDMLLITQDGAENLTRARKPRQIIAI